MKEAGRRAAAGWLAMAVGLGALASAPMPGGG